MRPIFITKEYSVLPCIPPHIHRRDRNLWCPLSRGRIFSHCHTLVSEWCVLVCCIRVLRWLRWCE